MSPGRVELRDTHLGTLILAGTPIGNVGDASLRLREILQTADVIAAEDTRKLRALATRLGISVSGKVIPCHEHNETEVAPQLLDAVASGQTVVLVTDAGMPAVSDPGYRLVAAASARGLEVTCIPGPSAAITALAVSGLPSDRFTFEGFLPRKPGARSHRINELSAEPRTMVFFEAPHRVLAAVSELAEILGHERPAALCRELTKIYEEVWRGTLGELAQRLVDRAAQPGGIRGEFVIVIGPPPMPDGAERDLVQLHQNVLQFMHDGATLKDAVTAVAAQTGVAKRELYNYCLAHKT